MKDLLNRLAQSPNIEVELIYEGETTLRVNSKAMDGVSRKEAAALAIVEFVNRTDGDMWDYLGRNLHRTQSVLFDGVYVTFEEIKPFMTGCALPLDQETLPGSIIPPRRRTLQEMLATKRATQPAVRQASTDEYMPWVTVAEPVG